MFFGEISEGIAAIFGIGRDTWNIIRTASVMIRFKHFDRVFNAPLDHEAEFIGIPVIMLQIIFNFINSGTVSYCR